MEEDFIEEKSEITFVGKDKMKEMFESVINYNREMIRVSYHSKNGTPTEFKRRFLLEQKDAKKQFFWFILSSTPGDTYVSFHFAHNQCFTPYFRMYARVDDKFAGQRYALQVRDLSRPLEYSNLFRIEDFRSNLESKKIGNEIVLIEPVRLSMEEKEAQRPTVQPANEMGYDVFIDQMSGAVSAVNKRSSSVASAPVNVLSAVESSKNSSSYALSPEQMFDQPQRPPVPKGKKRSFAEIYDEIRYNAALYNSTQFEKEIRGFIAESAIELMEGFTKNLRQKYSARNDAAK